MIILYAIKLLVFDFLYSFVIGGVLYLLMLPLTHRKNERESESITFGMSLVADTAATAVQGLIVA